VWYDRESHKCVTKSFVSIREIRGPCTRCLIGQPVGTSCDEIPSRRDGTFQVRIRVLPVFRASGTTA